MKKKYYETEQFKNLLYEWNEKLEQSGLKDIEFYQTNGNFEKKLTSRTRDFTYLLESINTENEIVLPPNCMRRDKLKNLNIENGNSWAEFFRLCGRFLHVFKFKSELDKKIFELFCEGFTYRAIVKTIKSENPDAKVSLGGAFNRVRHFTNIIKKNISTFNLCDEELGLDVEGK